MKINKIYFLYLFIVMAFFLSLYLSIFVPIQKIQPAYYDLALAIQNNNFQNTFYAFGYAALISGYIMNNVEITMRIVHFISLILTWVIVLYLCSNINLINKIKDLKFCDINFFWIFFWLGFLFFHPYFQINLIRITDTGFATLFIAAIYALIVLKFKFSKILLITCGILYGVLIAIRPNAIILILFFLIFSNKIFESKYQVIILFLSSLFTYIIFSKYITDELLFWPSYSGYNLFAGNNPFSYEFLKTLYNAEPSLSKGIEWCGIKKQNLYLISNIEYYNCTLNFVQNDFFGFIKTTIFKIYNLLFRPNLKEATELYKVILQILIVIPSYIWWLLFIFNSNFRKEPYISLGALFIVIYASIFIGTNTDPRLGLPLDIIYIMSAMSFTFKKKEQ